MAGFSEIPAVEVPMSKWISDLGWSYKDNEDLKRYKRPLANPIIDEILIDKIAAINSISKDEAKRVLPILTQHFNNPNSLEANELFLERVVKGVNIRIGEEDKTIRIIDFHNPWNNDFIVTRQYWVQGFELVKPDIALLINGIPLICVEAKQRAKSNSNYFKGIQDLSLYESKVPKLFISNFFGIAANGKFSKYGVLGASASYYYEWKDLSFEFPERNPAIKNKSIGSVLNPDTGLLDMDIPPYEQMRRSVCSLLQPERILDMLQNFMVFERSSEGGLIKKIARYQQYRAANKIVRRAETGDHKQGVVWHTQGSGKSLTILFTAYKLRHHKDLGDPMVYIIVDRKDLREQIGDTFEESDFPNTFKPNNAGQLKHKIKSQTSEVLITNIQKFRELDGVTDPRENVFVLIDEAHRTQYGDFHSELKAALPNAGRYAFTGTPIPKTIKEFGKISSTEIEKYLDRYSIQDAIDDGATREIIYTYGPTDLQIDKETLKKGWDELTESLEEDEKQEVQRRVRPWKTIIKKPERIAEIAKDIAKDFREKVEPNGFKAQVVGIDKEACVMYYDELLKNGFDPSEIQIVFSKTAKESEERYNLFKDHYLNEGELKKIIKKFKKRITPEEQRNGNNLKILIVCNMLLTGFDAPIEETMYLDSPLKEHTLLQAIARTNRPYDDKVSGVSKNNGRIVDYIGIDLNEALSYDPTDVGTFKDEESLFKDFPEAINKAMSHFDDITLQDSYECSIAIVRRLSELDHTEFEKEFRAVYQLYEAISPSALLVPYRDRYRWLIAIYQVYLSEYKRLDFDAEFYAAKTRQLLNEATQILGFKGHLPSIKIDSNYLDVLNGSKLSPDDKAEKIIRDIETVIRQSEVANPIYVDFLKRLEEIIKQKRNKSKRIEDTLIELEQLFTEVEETESLPQKMGFTDMGEFYFFQEMKNKFGDSISEDDSKALAMKLGNLIREKRYVGWADSEREKKSIKSHIEFWLCSEEFESLNLCDDDELAELFLGHMVNQYKL
ncbi:MAG: type I restriction endonuclease subunit R [Verrucomicrobia bacterium]|nr:type I restriction endonuclease subunit R [Verrucomicrobiota bacterium]